MTQNKKRGYTDKYEQVKYEPIIAIYRNEKMHKDIKTKIF